MCVRLIKFCDLSTFPETTWYQILNRHPRESIKSWKVQSAPNSDVTEGRMGSTVLKDGFPCICSRNEG